jgi:signal transduction histidine kinase
VVTWLRRYLPRGVLPLDLALALVFAAAGQLELQLSTSSAYRGSASLAASGVAGLLVSLPLVLRRRAPLAVLATVAAALVLPRLVLDTTVLFYGGFFPALVALYSASCYARAPRDRLALLAPGAILVGLSLEIASFRTGGEYAFSTAAFAGAWLVGQAARRWRATSERLRAALDELDATTALRERGAVDEERARIARELHDVVGHSISVMVLQAGAARLELQPEQARAREQLEAVEASGRAAMTEMRRMVAMMRPKHDDAPLAAPPSVQRLEPLLRQMRDAGLDVSLRVTGAQRVLPPGLDLSAYRIVQEALTNVARHAGSVPVAVEIAYESDALRLEVRNEAPATLASHTNGRAPAGSHGLLGMRERVALFGGSLDASPAGDGGFVVRASLRLDGGTA